MLSFYKHQSSPDFLFIRKAGAIEAQISKQAAESLFNIRWLEWDFSVSEARADGYLKPVPLDSFVICEMSDGCGWGLFARKPIQQGSTIGIFTGEVKFLPVGTQVNSEHVFIHAYDNECLVIDATNFGNITRFIQHLPSKEALENLEFSSEIDRSQIATENLVSDIVALPGVDGLTSILFRAIKDIHPGEILGCAYSPKYWEDKTAVFFMKNGEPIKPSSLCQCHTQYKSARSGI